MIDQCLSVEFRVQGDDCPLARASAGAGATVDANPPHLRADGNALVHASSQSGSGVSGALDSDDRVRYLHVADASGRETYRCLSKEPCLVHQLTNVGFLPESLRYRDGEEFHAGTVVGRDVLKGVLEAAGETVGVTLERASPLGTEGDPSVEERWNLTPAQSAAIEAGLELGYFGVPRDATASDIADELGISKSAFLERIHRAEAALFGQMYE